MHNFKREGFVIEKMNNIFYDIIRNSAILFSLWNYKTLKNRVKARQSMCFCVCACVREKKHERRRASPSREVENILMDSV